MKASYRGAIHDAIADAMRADERVVLLGEDVGRYGGTYAVSKGLLEEFGPDRVRDTPISDKVITESNYNFKYVSIWRDESGDPVAQWAILTRDIGVPQPLFLNALQRYLEIVRDFGEIAFADDEAPKLDKTTASAPGGSGAETAK